MFDVLPASETGDLACNQKSIRKAPADAAKKTITYQLGVGFESDQLPICHDYEISFTKKAEQQDKSIKRQDLLVAENVAAQEGQAQLKTRSEWENEMRREVQRIDMLQKKAKLERERLAKERMFELEKERMEERAKEKEKRLLAMKEMELENNRNRMLAQKAQARRIDLAAQKAVELERLKIEREREHEQKRQLLLEEERINYEKEQLMLAQEKAERQLAWEQSVERTKRVKKEKNRKVRSGANFNFTDFLVAPKFSFGFNLGKAGFSFVSAALIIVIGIGGVSFAQRGLALKGKVLDVSQDGYQNLASAAASLAGQNFSSSAKEFSLAYDNFSQAADDLNGMGKILVEGSRFFPYASKLSSGKNVAEAGKHIAAAGQSLNEVLKTLAMLKNPLNENERSGVSLLDVFNDAQKNVSNAKIELAAAQESIEKVNIDDLPKEKQDKFLLLKEKLPFIIDTFDEFLNNTSIVADLLGGNGPRKYLFLFQNNTEMRATGGFIGSYGLLDISQGHVKNFFIDGIFNPDGQLKAKIIPPVPIQKISAAWSLHDSNWFPDFPASAREAIKFYEKTGGPTVDGVITLTPTVMEKLLAITGPIEMSEYDVVLTAENFVEKTQYEVEVDYDKEENKPKKILSDLAPILLEKVVSSKDMRSLVGAAKVLSDGLKEKHILLYSENQDLQKIISGQGWSGEVLPAQKDYLSVINTNINGYKTDAVVDEAIWHQSEIKDDGSIVDTVVITRKHNGGNAEYEWWNKVNANYMRVYVPKGSQLIEASGQTRETNYPPLDYVALGFKKDSQIEKEESTMYIDEESGTRIYEDADKTVFANWTYVSPGETVTITYKYLLPFRLFQIVSNNNQENADSFSLVVQKQSGSRGDEFFSTLSFPTSYELKWSYPENCQIMESGLESKSVLDTDQFVGAVFQQKGH